MNVFKVLANGDGSINEPNISAFLAYLLDPNQDHGLRFEFLCRFLSQVDIKDFRPEKYDYEIILEQAFRDENSELKKREIVDIIILCFDSNKGNYKEIVATNIINTQKQLKYVFLIENKVNNSAKKEEQLYNQFVNFVSTIEKINTDFKSENVYSIYLTPENSTFNEEFTKFALENENGTHIKWIVDEEKPDTENENEENSTLTIYGILKQIIVDENNGKIEAINEYTKHTIISFIKFIENDFKSQRVEEKERKNDGKYTQYYIDININSDIENKLDKLRDELLKRNESWNSILSKPNLSRPRFPFLTLVFGAIDIQIHAGSVSRDKIAIVYRSNRRDENSFEQLQKVANKLNIKIKKAEYKKDAYTQTEKMKTKISISDFEAVYNALNEAINQASY